MKRRVIWSLVCSLVLVSVLNAGNWFTNLFESLPTKLIPLPLTEQEEIKKEHPFEQGGTITLINKAGMVSLTSWDEDTIVIEATKRATKKEDLEKIDVHISLDKKTAVLETKYPQNMQAQVQYEIKIPKKAFLKSISTGVGEITVAGIHGKVHAKTGAGSIKLSDVVGPLYLDAGAGSISVSFGEKSEEPVEAKTGSGSVKIVNADGLLDVTTGSGSITVCQRSLPKTGSMSFFTGTGDIKLKLPQESNAVVSGGIGLGSFHSDFKGLTLSKKKLSGTLGKGGPTIKINSGLGSIEITKADPGVPCKTKKP